MSKYIDCLVVLTSMVLSLCTVQHNNLRKIYKSLMDFYSNVLHVTLTKFESPDLQAIAESDSPQHTARLIQLMLGVAINCEQKDSKFTVTTYPIHLRTTFHPNYIPMQYTLEHPFTVTTYPVHLRTAFHPNYIPSTP